MQEVQKNEEGYTIIIKVTNDRIPDAISVLYLTKRNPNNPVQLGHYEIVQPPLSQKHS